MNQKAWIQPAAAAWEQLYEGKIEPYRIGAAPGIDTVAVRRADFRDQPGNWPKIFHHGGASEKVLVLVHGLKDSPGYVEDIALRFAADGNNVVLPLLPAHGRRDPVPAMRGADVETWRAMVDRAVEIAAMLGQQISIGGLSTGGALSVDKCLRDPDTIDGKVFLFSAALGLRPHQRLVLSTSFVPRWIDAWLARRPNTGIGGDPCKYSRTFFNGARQVHLLIRELRHADGFERRDELRGRVFVAHSEADTTIHIDAVQALVQPEDPGQHHIIAATENVGHAELVMAEPMIHTTRWPDEPEPPRANPEFEGMIRKALAFLDR